MLEMISGNELKFIVLKRELRERVKGKWNIVKRKLFPGYILIRGNIDTEMYYKMKNSFEVGSLLRDEDGLLIIDEKESLTLSILVNNEKGSIGISKAFKENEKIKILERPLIGLEGYIQSIGTISLIGY